MDDRMMKGLLVAGVAMIGLAAAGLVPTLRSAPGTTVSLTLASGGTMAEGTTALLRQTGPDGSTQVTTAKVETAAGGAVSLVLPRVAGPTLTEIALMAAEDVSFHVAPFIDAPAPEDDGTGPMALMADPAVLVPLIDQSLTCATADGPQDLRVSRAATGGLAMDWADTSLPLLAAETGFAAGPLRLHPLVDGSARATLPGGDTVTCTRKTAAPPLPLRVAGDGWVVVIGPESIGFAGGGLAPQVLAGQGTLARIEGDRLDRILYRAAQGDGTPAPRVEAVYATCTDPQTAQVHSWRLEVEGADGAVRTACAGWPMMPWDGDWQLTALNGVHRETGAEITLRGPAFSARSSCHAYEGHVVPADGKALLRLDWRQPLADCPEKKGRAMADALHSALAQGAELTPSDRGDVVLRAGFGLTGAEINIRGTDE
jgi:hypothetical protein